MGVLSDRAIKCYVTQWGWGRIWINIDQCYKGVWFNVISVVGGEEVSNFQKKALRNT